MLELSLKLGKKAKSPGGRGIFHQGAWGKTHLHYLVQVPEKSRQMGQIGWGHLTW